VGAVAVEASWVGKRDPAFERARAAEAVSGRNRFEDLLDRHEARLRRVAFGMLVDPSRVDDVLQEAFIRAYRKLPARFESEKQEAAWLYRIVYRSCLNEIRSMRRRAETPGLDHITDVATTEDLSDSLALMGALGELTPDVRAVVLLVDFIGFDYETAASVLGIPRGTVAWRLSVARAGLRALLLDDHGDGDG
jgi:RNA polymerase sigma-70 factor (ECF subfamily)